MGTDSVGGQSAAMFSTHDVYALPQSPGVSSFLDLLTPEARFKFLRGNFDDMVTRASHRVETWRRENADFSVSMRISRRPRSIRDSRRLRAGRICGLKTARCCWPLRG
jgi:hypothetical protein